MVISTEVKLCNLYRNVAINMKNITINEALKIFRVDSIESINTIPKEYYNKFDFHVAGNKDYLQASKGLSSFFGALPLSNSSKAYRKGYSYLDFFRPHISSNYFLRLDVKSFFHTIPKSSINHMILSHLKGPKQYEKEQLAKQISNFLTIEHEGKPILPIGFPASPNIANLVFRPLDIQIDKLCLEKGIKYSRYSDDLLFSSNDNKAIHSDWFETNISYILAQLNMKLNCKKRIKTKDSISLNGYVISGDDLNKSISFSNKRLKFIRKLVHAKKIKKMDDLSIMRKYFFIDIAKVKLKYPSQQVFLKRFAAHQILNKLRGFRSYLLSIVNYGNKHNCIELDHQKILIQLVNDINLIIAKYDI